MSTYLIKDRFVQARRLTHEQAEGYLWNGRELPEGLAFSSASHHPKDKKIAYFYARTTNGLRVEIDEWYVTYSDGSVQVFTQREFADQFEAA